MNPSDYKCKDCNKVFTYWKKSLDSFPIHPECEYCKSINTKRIYSNIVTDVCEGKFGNSKTGYKTGITYHPGNIVGRMKGKRIK